MYIQNRKRFITFILIILVAASSTYILIMQKGFRQTDDLSLNKQSGTLEVIVLTKKVKNENILSGFYNQSSAQFVPSPLQISGDNPLSETDYYKISQKDNIGLTTNSSETFPYQKYSIRIGKDLSSLEKLNVTWQGSSNRMVDLYAWDYIKQQWIMLQKTIGRDKNNLAITGALNLQSMVKDGVSNIMVATAQKNSVLKGKIPESDEYDFTFAWMSDTQYYSASYSEIYDKMTKYIVDNQKDKKIIYTIHTGDLVDNVDETYQWKNADKSMKILDKAGIPYGVLAGNHDVGHTLVNYTNYFNYFGEKRFNGNKVFGGTPNNNRNHYDLVSAGGKDFIVVYLGWSITQESINWTNDILKKYSDRKAILATHGYISQRGSFVEQGREIFEKIVTPNKNILMVLCGHYGGAVVNVKRDDSKVFYEMISNYQFNEEGGMGYLRFLHFDAKNDLVYINTYSPYKEDYNFYDDNKEEFILPLTEEKGDIILSTDYIDIGD